MAAAAGEAATACKLLPCNDTGLSEAAEMLRAGRCVAFPTETVYGLGANALDVDAVLRVFQYKGRPLTDPLIVHVPDLPSALALVDLPKGASAAEEGPPSSSSSSSSPARVSAEVVFRRLASTFWPGPLTLVARGVPSIPDKVMAGTGFVGVRVPANVIAQRLLQLAGIPVAAPSANRFGHVSPTRAKHVVADLGSHPIGVVLSEHDDDDSDEYNSNGAASAGGVDAGTAAVGIESTVVKIEEVAGTTQSSPSVRVLILRRGGISEQQLRECLLGSGGDVELVVKPVAGTTPIPDTPGAGGKDKADALQSSGAGAVPASAGQGGLLEGGGEGGGEGGVGMEAPGMLLTHYAPDVETFLVTSATPVGTDPLATRTVPQVALRQSAGASAASSSSPSLPIPSWSSSVVVDFGGLLAPLRGLCAAYRDLSPAGSVTEARKQLFEALRWAEGVKGATAVFLADPAGSAATTTAKKSAEGAEHTDALRDRMYRAASGKEVHIML